MNRNLAVSGIVGIVDAMVNWAVMLFEENSDWEKERSGGYFCLVRESMNAKTSTGGLPIILVPCGVFPLEKAEKYLNLCQEKAKRLAILGGLSSWESRNPEENKWGGAVRFRDLIFSFSGFPELADEAVMLATAIRYYNAPDISMEAWEIARRSQNPYWDILSKYH